MVALSSDGLNFNTIPQVIGSFYMRVFRWNNSFFGFTKGGELFQSKDGIIPFKVIGNPFIDGPLGAKIGDPHYNRSGCIRHLAVDINDNVLAVYYTKIGDSPERIYRSFIDLTVNPAIWEASPPEEILRPETEYEGARLPIEPSKSSAGYGNAVRDPYVYTEGNKKYLLYSVKGEAGIAIAEIKEK
jgi:hypothetical protein